MPCDLEFGSASGLVEWAFLIKLSGGWSSSSLGKTGIGSCQDMLPDELDKQATDVMEAVNTLEFGPRLALWTLYHGGEAHIIVTAELVRAAFSRDVPRAALRECVRHWIGDDGAAPTARVGELAGVSQRTGHRIRQHVCVVLDGLRRQGLDVIEARFSELLTGNGVDQYPGR